MVVIICCDYTLKLVRGLKLDLECYNNSRTNDKDWTSNFIQILQFIHKFDIRECLGR